MSTKPNPLKETAKRMRRGNNTVTIIVLVLAFLLFLLFWPGC